MDLDALAPQIPDEVIDYIETLESQVVDLHKRLAETQATATEGIDAVSKALADLSPEVATIVKSQMDRLAAAEAELAAERVAKADSEWTARMRALDGVVDPKEIGPALRALSETNADLADRLEKALTAASERIAKSALFTEFGHAASAPTSVEGRIEQVAKSLSAADPKLSESEARALAWEQHPDLYTEHLAEQRQRRS